MDNRGSTDTAAPAQKGEFTITRVFDAPRELVWKALTEPERLKHRWGPKGFTVRSAEVDLRPGVAHNATAAERETFEAGFDGMDEGFTGTLDQLAGYLAAAKV